MRFKIHDGKYSRSSTLDSALNGGRGGPSSAPIPVPVPVPVAVPGPEEEAVAPHLIQASKVGLHD